MGLIRNATVLACGVMLLPSDPQQQEQLFQKAASAAYWTATFCDRNATTCETASAAWGTFVAKAQFAGKLAYDAAQRYASQQEGGLAPAEFRPGDGARIISGTLQPHDLEPQWRGAARAGGA